MFSPIVSLLTALVDSYAVLFSELTELTRFGDWGPLGVSVADGLVSGLVVAVGYICFHPFRRLIVWHKSPAEKVLPKLVRNAFMRLELEDQDKLARVIRGHRPEHKDIEDGIVALPTHHMEAGRWTDKFDPKEHVSE